MFEREEVLLRVFNGYYKFDRNIFYIDVGNMSKESAEKYLKEILEKYKGKFNV